MLEVRASQHGTYKELPELGSSRELAVIWGMVPLVVQQRWLQSHRLLCAPGCSHGVFAEAGHGPSSPEERSGGVTASLPRCTRRIEGRGEAELGSLRSVWG